MKYGYMYYQKPLISEMPSRPINLGDPIQSYAVKLLYREMGIKEEDIIPVPRYDLTNYDGEECVCVINTCSTYEELAYDSHFMPPSNKIHAVPISIHLHRDLPKDELDFYKTCGSVGCRDTYTMEYLQNLGIDAYLSGCLTITFPRRTREEESKADKVYLINVPEGFKQLIPEEIRRDAIELSNIQRFDICHDSNRMTEEEADEFHRQGEERVKLLRDTAKLVITSRLHIATPCLAMGIPVILTNHDDRFGFIDRFVPSYTKEHYDEIDWNPKPVDIEAEKTIIKQVFFAKVRAVASRVALEKMWSYKKPIYDSVYQPTTVSAIEKIQFPKDNFKYAVWGIISNPAYYTTSEIKRIYPQAELVCGVDSNVTKNFCGVRTISPELIDTLDKDVIIIVAVQAAFSSAKSLLLPTGRRFILLKGSVAECYNF